MSSRNNSNSELAIAFENIIRLVDLSRRDVVEIDKILRTGVNGNPSVIVELDRLKQHIVQLEQKIDTCIEDVKTLDENKSSVAVGKDNDKRIKSLEKIKWIGFGIITMVGLIVSYGDKVRDGIKLLLGT